MKAPRSKLLFRLACGTMLGAPQLALAQPAPVVPPPPSGTAPETSLPAPAVDTTDASASAVPTNGALGDIIVTAQKRSERLQDVPMSITAASAQQLQSAGVTTTDQLVKLVPGLTYDKSTYGLPVFFIRGVGFNDSTLGVGPAVSVYVDQIPLPYGAMTRGAVLDLERVEVLKGPQGTLFGQNSTGGAINYIAAKPTSSLQAGMSLTYGRFDEVDAEAYVSGPLTSTLSARIAVREEYQGDWQKGYTLNDSIGQKSFQNARLLVDWKPSPAARFELEVTGWRDRSDTQQQQLIEYFPPGNAFEPYPIRTYPPAPDNDRAAGFDPNVDFRRNDRFYQFALHGDINLSDTVTLTSLTSYAHFKTVTPLDFDATPYPIARSYETGSITTFSQELRLGGMFGDRIKWMVGGNYEHDHVPEKLLFDPIDTSTNTIANVAVHSQRLDNDQRVRTISGFGSLDFQLSDRLTLQGSARYTKQNRDFTGCSRDNNNNQLGAAFSILSSIFTGEPQTIPTGGCITLGNDFIALPIVNSKLDQHNVSWRASVNYKLTPQALFYANITKGYKAGSFPTYPAALVSQLHAVPQESVLAYEAGFKLQAFDRKVQLDGAAFYYDYKKKQLNGFLVVPPFGPLPNLVSIPKASVKGGELSLITQPFEGLQLSASTTYVDTKVLRNPPDPTGPFGNPGSFTGQAFPFSPRWQGTVDAQYRFPVSDTLFTYVGGNASVRSHTVGSLVSGDPALASQEALLRIKGYTLVDLRAGVEPGDGRWRIELFGRNVFDKFYLVSANRIADYVTRFTGTPATYGVTVRYKFSG